jgi:nitrogen fixation-related uncharacterized protein
MKLDRTWMGWATALLALCALWWGISPAWNVWRLHSQQFDQLERQRIAMQTDREEALALQKKTVLPPADALSHIKAISTRMLGATPQTLTGNLVQVQIKAVSADQLAQAWTDIRKLTSAMVVKAELNANGQAWTGTLVFKLAEAP